MLGAFIYKTLLNTSQDGWSKWMDKSSTWTVFSLYIVFDKVVS